MALQVLVEMDYQPDLTPDRALALYHGAFPDGDPDMERALNLPPGSAQAEAPSPAAAYGEARRFAERIVRGFGSERGAVDARIVQASRNWRLERMARVDRNLLRLAVWELGWARAEVPPRVAINEAIEIAKRYGASETSAFVNGVLDRVLADLGGAA